MSREIKFRAFDKRDKKMICVGFHVFGEVTLLHGIEAYCHETKDERDSYQRLVEDIEVMQFTGLKDKNGKEIYENDVLCFEDKFHYQVVYQDAKFVCLHAAKSNTMAGTLWGALHRFFDPDFLVYGGIEVIGNKFENPELLTI